MQPVDELKTLFRDIPDFPRPGILFKDITPLLAHPKERKIVTQAIYDQFKNQQIDAIACIEARGFLFGMLLAEHLDVPFIPVRKEGKLPYKKVRSEYALEYGNAAIEIHADSIEKGWRVLIHDDLLATGGTAAAAGDLIEQLGGRVGGFSFIVQLSFLPGASLLENRFGVTPHYLITY
ncbi:MAG: adenine phosphoribosyltransferase [Cyclobacteriaceae bacterium]